MLLYLMIYFSSIILISAFFRNQSNNFNTSLSIVVSDVSSWVLIGLPALIYKGNFIVLFLPLGLLMGFYMSLRCINVDPEDLTDFASFFSNSKADFNKKSVHFSKNVKVCTLKKANKLNLYRKSENLNINLENLSSNKYIAKIKKLVSLVIFFYFTIYISSGLKSGAMTLSKMVDFNYIYCLIFISLFTLFYTSLFSLKNLVSADVIQAAIILFVMVYIVVYLGFNHINSVTSFKFFNFKVVCFKSFLSCKSFFMILSNLSWGLGYFGQPHILSKLGLLEKKTSSFVLSTVLLMLLVFSLSISIGFLGKELDVKSPEDIFFTSALKSFGGKYVFLCFISLLAAILSTILSQVISLVNTFVNLNRFFITFTVIFISSLVSMLDLEINNLVSLAWGGLGSAFGPVLLYKIYGENYNLKKAYRGILLGFISNILIFIILKLFRVEYIYELMLSFALNCIFLFKL